MGLLILVAESDPFNLRLLSDVCETSGWDVASASDVASALDVIARKRPELVIADASLDGGSPLEVLRVLKADASLAPIPVLVALGEHDDEHKRAAIALGAEDYLARPYRVYEIQHRIQAALRRWSAERKLVELEGEVLLDPVTRAGSGLQMQITLEYEMTRAVRYGHALTCVSLHVSGLDAVDRLGPGARDGVLMQLVGNVRTCIRGIDHLFRPQADELVILLPETSPADATAVVARLRDRAARGELLGAAVSPVARVELGVAGRAERDVSEGLALLGCARETRAPL